MQNKANIEDKNRISKILLVFYWILLIASFVVIGRIIYIQYFWEPDPEYLHYFQPRKKKMDIDPDRGAIIDHNGNLLAMSTPMYNIYMDCYVLKEAHYADTRNGAKNEEEWVGKAKKLAAMLPQVLKEEGKDESYYNTLIFNGRRNKRRYVP